MFNLLTESINCDIIIPETTFWVQEIKSNSKYSEKSIFDYKM